MRSRDFCYWLQGYFELAGTGQEISMKPEQIMCIQKHLELVFTHEIDPEMGGEETQNQLNDIHGNNSGVTLRC